MLAVGASLAAAPTAVTTSTISPLPYAPSLLANHSLDVPQGDQAPVPPFPEGRPYRPDHWDWSTNRTLYMKNRYGKFLEMWPNGRTQGVSETSSFCVFVLLSHLTNLVMKGYVSEKFLCMNSTTYRLYAREEVHEDCYLQEALRNGSGHNVYNFASCLTPARKKCYLGMFRNGTMRLGKEARQSQQTAQWLPMPVSRQEREHASDQKETIKKGGWLPPTAPVPTPSKPVNKKEQTRKRVRRWCRNLNVIMRNSLKFLRRCKHDCEVLKKMIANPKRYMRRCLFNHVRRRARNKALKSGRDVGAAVDSAKIRARVQKLWPKRHDIFQRLRQLRRCNKRRRHRKGGRKRGSCSKRELRRELRRRAQQRSQSTKSSGADSSQSPSRSRSTSSSKRTARRRIRHERKKSGRNRRHAEDSSRAEVPQPKSHTSSLILTALTSG